MKGDLFFMKNLNHVAWGRVFTKKQIIAILCVLSFVAATAGLLATGTVRRFTVFYNNRCQIVNALHATPEAVLESAGIALREDHGYEVEDTEAGTVIRVGPELNVAVTVDGVTANMVTRTDRVQNLLQEMGVHWDNDDIITPSPNTIITKDCDITVKRVDTARVVRIESVKPKVVYKETDSMPQGTEKVLRKGVAGSQMVTYKEKMVDGVVTDSKALSSVVTCEPVSKVILRGTAAKEKFAPVVTTDVSVNSRVVSKLTAKNPIKVDSKGVPVHYKKCIKGLATAYTANKGARTAIGDVAQVGYVAVDPKIIPYGTKMFIKTSDGRYVYGLAKASDTGGFTSGPVDVDLFFNTEAECIQFGVRDVEIYILD